MTTIRTSILLIIYTFLVALAPLVHAANSPFYPGALPVLVGIEDVRNDLKLTSLQEVVLDSIRNEYRSDAQQIYAATNFQNAASCAHADRAIIRLQLKYNRRVLSTLNRGQKARLAQMEIRMQDGFLLLKESCQQRLALHPAQKAKIAKIETKTIKILHRLNRLAMQKKMTALKRMTALHILRRNSSEELLKILTPAQRQQLVGWRKITTANNSSPMVHRAKTL